MSWYNVKCKDTHCSVALPEGNNTAEAYELFFKFLHHRVGLEAGVKGDGNLSVLPMGQYYGFP